MLQVQSFTFNPFQENTYIIHNNVECIIVDPGMFQPKEFAELYGFITAHKLTPKLVLNTHCHLDHIFGVHACMEKYNIQFAIHQQEVVVLDDAINAGIKYGVPVLHKPIPSFFISETEQIVLGTEKLNLILVPGHSPGHLCIYHQASNFVIAGDALFNGSIGRTDLIKGDYNLLIQSIQTQLFTLPENTVVYSGHGPSTTIGLEKMNNPFFR